MWLMHIVTNCLIDEIDTGMSMMDVVNEDATICHVKT